MYRTLRLNIERLVHFQLKQSLGRLTRKFEYLNKKRESLILDTHSAKPTKKIEKYLEKQHTGKS